MDRDYSTKVSLTLQWREWNILWELATRQVEYMETADEWEGSDLDRYQHARNVFSRELGDNSPGNGMDDWPESMQEAYNKAVMETIEDLE